MDLKTYTISNGIAQQDLATMVSVSKSIISLVVNGHRRPSPELALRIERATNSQVTRDELLFPELYKEGS